MTVPYIKLVGFGVKKTTAGSTMLIRVRLIPDVKIGLASLLSSQCLMTIRGFNLSTDYTNAQTTSICCCDRIQSTGKMQVCPVAKAPEEEHRGSFKSLPFPKTSAKPKEVLLKTSLCLFVQQ
ncbi:hypothetical protein AV530_008082 [Patagioenas fasciata monilis]|uniref:Uncharacterized protein n=1 Tax=Patagioenas fasciata monilis TaxID=372326 RepID=A0A1V4KUP4_PATFA|nr:hypothetical protein AV530_008082 [Patagioenas fasciata monilis]